MDDKQIYLDTYILQQDMRIRLPKAILSNMNVQKGITKFDVFLSTNSSSLILKIHDEGDKNDEK